jgi:hypothetical protein
MKFRFEPIQSIEAKLRKAKENRVRHSVAATTSLWYSNSRLQKEPERLGEHRMGFEKGGDSAKLSAYLTDP